MEHGGGESELADRDHSANQYVIFSAARFKRASAALTPPCNCFEAKYSRSQPPIQVRKKSLS